MPESLEELPRMSPVGNVVYAVPKKVPKGERARAAEPLAPAAASRPSEPPLPSRSYRRRLQTNPFFTGGDDDDDDDGGDGTPQVSSIAIRTNKKGKKKKLENKRKTRKENERKRKRILIFL